VEYKRFGFFPTYAFSSLVGEERLKMKLGVLVVIEEGMVLAM